MMATDCLFCKFVSGEISTQKVFENDHVLAFKDIAPAAETHLLFIHKKHTQDVFEMSRDDLQQTAQIFEAIQLFAEENNFHEKGFRLVTNCGKTAGQTIFHTHFHFLSDKKLGSFGN